jgi:hypothetical protein
LTELQPLIASSHQHAQQHAQAMAMVESMNDAISTMETLVGGRIPALPDGVSIWKLSMCISTCFGCGVAFRQYCLFGLKVQEKTFGMVLLYCTKGGASAEVTLIHSRASVRFRALRFVQGTYSLV